METLSTVSYTHLDVYKRQELQLLDNLIKARFVEMFGDPVSNSNGSVSYTHLIRIGRKDATDEEVMAAARLANCTDFLEKLPDKWNTMPTRWRISYSLSASLVPISSTAVSYTHLDVYKRQLSNCTSTICL